MLHLISVFFSGRSPVFSHLSSTLQGLTTLRAFGMVKKFEEEFHQRQDLHSCTSYRICPVPGGSIFCLTHVGGTEA